MATRRSTWQHREGCGGGWMQRVAAADKVQAHGRAACTCTTCACACDVWLQAILSAGAPQHRSFFFLLAALSALFSLRVASCASRAAASSRSAAALSCIGVFLPPPAAGATTAGGATTTALQALAAGERVDEIARMLGGARVTAKTVAHARDLLAQAAGEP